GNVYFPPAGEKLPDEPRRLAVVLTGKRSQPSWQDAGAAAGDLNFYDMKGVIEALVHDLHLPNVTCRRAENAPHLHPGRSADLLLGGKPGGTFGALHPKVAKAFDLAGRTVLAGEFDLEAILSAIPGRSQYWPVPRLPAALRDVGVVVPEDVTAERVLAEICTAGRALLRDVRLFDLYRGPSIPART